ncbi:MAG: HAD-IA family hydrolase [Pseudonocardiaceae bacterium]
MTIKLDISLRAGAHEFMCAAVLFDLDGVLVASQPLIERQLRSWADLQGLDSATVVRLSHGRTDVDLIREVAPHLDAEEEAGLMAEREALDTHGLQPCHGAAEIIALLPEHQWGIVTSGHSSVARARLSAAGLPEPQVFVTAERVHRGKPAPDGYLLGAHLLGIDPKDCVVIEDAPAGVSAARAAGAQVLGVDPTNELDLGADFVVTGLETIQVKSCLGRRP